MLRNRKGSVFYRQPIPVLIAAILILLMALLFLLHLGGGIALASQPLSSMSRIIPSVAAQIIWKQPNLIEAFEPLTIITTLPPKRGDLLYKLNLDSWAIGHVGIYTGEFTYAGNTMRLDNASTVVKLWRVIKPPKEGDCVIQGNKYNVVEANADGVIYRYYQPISLFGKGGVFMGARTVTGEPLTPAERQAVVDFVTTELGKGYAYGGTIGISGACQGHLVKGPEQYMCVGLAERAYELIGRDIVPEADEEDWMGLIPFRQFQHTKPIDYVEVEAGTELAFSLEAVRTGFALTYPEPKVSWDISGKPPRATFGISPEDDRYMEFVWETLPTDSGSEYKVTFTAIQGGEIATQTITIKVVPAR